MDFCNERCPPKPDLLAPKKASRYRACNEPFLLRFPRGINLVLISKAWQAHKMSFQSQPSINSFFRQLIPQEREARSVAADQKARAEGSAKRPLVAPIPTPFHKLWLVHRFFLAVQCRSMQSADKCLYAQNVAHVCLQHQNKKKWKLAWTCNGPFWQIIGPFPWKQCISCNTDGPFPKNFLKIN